MLLVQHYDIFLSATRDSCINVIAFLQELTLVYFSVANFTEKFYYVHVKLIGTSLVLRYINTTNCYYLLSLLLACNSGRAAISLAGSRTYSYVLYLIQ